MSYLVLARKYRPRSFDDVVGQEAMTATLRGAIDEGRVGHAYLFSGPRGTGKTTTARILAKALNCEKGPKSAPCGVCERCVATDNGSDLDVVEIDAASNNGVDFVRELREQAAYMPLRARFKIYIIDEVHMLSKPAFNALLKTLEEPPPHVKFLFATTESSKVIDTVLSRCQVVRLMPLSERTIAARLTTVFEREGIAAGPGVVEEIAGRARGGMRDALSMADQLLSLAGDAPTVADLARLSWEGGPEAIDQLLDKIAGGDRAGVLASLPRDEGGEGEFVSVLLDHLRGALLSSVCGSEHPLLSQDPAQRERTAHRAQRTSIPLLQIWLEELVHARERMRELPSHARLILELTLLDLCRPESRIDAAELEERLAALEQRLGSGRPAGALDLGAEVPASAGTSERAKDTPAVLRPQAAPSARAARPAPSSRAVPAAAAPASGPALWAAFLAALQQRSSSLADLLRSRGKLAEHAGGEARIALSGLDAREHELLHDARNARLCADVFSEVAGRATRVSMNDAPRVAPARPAPDAFTAQVADLFGGRVEEDA